MFNFFKFNFSVSVCSSSIDLAFNLFRFNFYQSPTVVVRLTCHPLGHSSILGRQGGGLTAQCAFLSFQSSLERGCLSLECLILNAHPAGLSFWKRMLGARRIEAVLTRSRLDWKRRQMRRRLKLEPLKKTRHSRYETVVELDRCEMKKLLESVDNRADGKVNSEICTTNVKLKFRDHGGSKKILCS